MSSSFSFATLIPNPFHSAHSPEDEVEATIQVSLDVDTGRNKIYHHPTEVTIESVLIKETRRNVPLRLREVRKHLDDSTKEHIADKAIEEWEKEREWQSAAGEDEER